MISLNIILHWLYGDKEMSFPEEIHFPLRRVLTGIFDQVKAYKFEQHWYIPRSKEISLLMKKYFDVEEGVYSRFGKIDYKTKEGVALNLESNFNSKILNPYWNAYCQL